MSSRSRSVSRGRLHSLVAMLGLASACSTGGPILTGTSPLSSPTPTPVATPVPTATPTPTPAATPTPATTPTPGNPGDAVTIIEGSVSLAGGTIATSSVFNLNQAGSLNFVADWTSAQNDIDIALANGSCTPDQLNAGACTFAGLEESATLKPETLTLSLPAGPYTALIGNFTAATETITYKIVFTPSASATSRGALASPVVAKPVLGVPALIKMTGKLGRTPPRH